MTELDLFFRFGVALIIGILVGLQREHASGAEAVELFAGVRTFALTGLLGCGAALASDTLASPWPFVAVILTVGVFLAVSHFIDAWRGRIGLTTEISALLTLLTGALVYWDQIVLAVALAVVITTLLSLKVEMHRFAHRLGREDIYATLKFAIITAIVLPILPNQVYGPPPFDVLNPYKIWLLVVLISGVSFVGYVLIKLVDPRKGIGLIGFLGGLASSTAVTLSFTQRSQTAPALARPFALAITVAWTVMYLRVLLIVAALNIGLVQQLWPPIAASVLAGLSYGLYLFLAQGSEKQEVVELANPFELGPAIKFGLIFTAVLLISKAAQVYLGNTGIYVSSFVSGIADMDAVALSLADLSRPAGNLALAVAVRAIVLAAVASTLTKGIIVLAGGSPGLRRAIWPGFGLMTITSLAVAFMV